MKKILQILILLALVQVSLAQLSGPLSGTLGPGTYHVIGDISVNLGSTLQMLPGARFIFDGPYSFSIYGILSAEGTQTDSIIFMADTLFNPDRWRGIRFWNPGSSTSRLTYCRVEGGLVTGDWPDNCGGGIGCFEGANPTIRYCRIIRNKAHSGGGIYCSHSSPTLLNCTIRENTATQNGGGLYCSESSLIAENCDVSANTAPWGGAFACIAATPAITNCVFSRNRATLKGGGIYCELSSPQFVGCTVDSNSASSDGGALYCSRTSADLDHCLIAGNVANGNGGGVFLWDSCASDLTNCTISGNAAAGNAGGMYCYRSPVTVSSTIISFSTGSGVFFSNSSDAEFEYCDIHGNSGGNITFNFLDPSQGPAGIGVISGTNANGDLCDQYQNIFLDPIFVNAAAGDFHLQSSSPCVDAGNPHLPLDPDGTVADIGAFFYDHGFGSPSAFSLLSPQWGDTCWSLDTTLVWQAAIDFDANDTVNYEVWLDTLSDLSTAWGIAAALSDTAFSIDDLADDHAYYWTVHASDLNTLGTWAEDTLMFRTYHPDPPQEFALAEPTNGDTVFTATPTLRWRTSSDPDPGDVVCYHLMWSYEADFSVYDDTTLSDTSFTFPPGLLLMRGIAGGKTELPLRVWRPTTAGNGSGRLDEVEDDSTVYWKVEALDQFGLATCCEPEEGWSFHVYLEEPPLGFDLLSPPNGNTIDALLADLFWEASSDPDVGDSVAFYRVCLALDSTFSTGLDSQQVNDTGLTWDDLQDDQTYWWRVKAFDTHGNGTASNQSWCFHTYYCELPAAFSLLEPADSLMLMESVVTCRWQAAHDPDPGDTVTYTLRLTTTDTSFSYETNADTCWTLHLGEMGLECGPLVEWWVEALSDCPDAMVESASHYHFYPPSAASIEDVLLPKEFALCQNYPNPFNPITTIRYDVPMASEVRLMIMNLLGQKVATLVNARQLAGSHTVLWDATNWPSGVYLCRMEASGFVQTRKMVLVK